MKRTFYARQQVKFASLTNPQRWFHAIVLGTIGDGFYTLVEDGTGRPPRIVRSERLMIDASTQTSQVVVA